MREGDATMNIRNDKHQPQTALRVVLTATAIALIAGKGVSTADAQTSCAQGKYLATYRDTSGQKFSRCENGPINQNWQKEGPKSAGSGDDDKSDGGNKALASDNFSATWIGKFRFDSGTYVFSTEADDGIRVSIDGARFIDHWVEGSERINKQRVMSAGVHQIRVEYFEKTGLAMVKVSWRRL
jgi:hypothetical protein